MATVAEFEKDFWQNTTGLVTTFEIPNGGIVSRAVTAAAANIKRRSVTGRASKHYSVSVFYSMATEQDNEIEDELSQVQKTLRDLKTNISMQSKNNFLLERDVRHLDSRIALLIQNRMALDEQMELQQEYNHDGSKELDQLLDERKLQQYGNLFFLLQSEPHYIASLCRLVSISEIDTLLQTVMFTLYGNQYESREENLLLTMFQNVLATQFESTVEFGSLLRANTPVSRMLTTYTRRGPGQSYLKSVLSHKINQLIEQKDLNLQINPLKVYDEVVNILELENGVLPLDISRSVTPDIAALNTDVQALIQPRLHELIKIANEFLSIIIDSLDQIPYGIRWICKQIKLLAKRKYPDASDSNISSLVGGFFFLRYINPAIVTPQAYMLIESYPGSNPRTILTLIAKMLQNLANKPSYAKETYMIPTNPFVTDNKQRINQFLNGICEVDDFYESLEMDQYMALSRKDIHIHITPNELYSTQELLCQHLDQLAPGPAHHLRVLLKDLGIHQIPKQLPRNLNKPIQLPLYGRWDTNNLASGITDLEVSDDNCSIITQKDIMYMETKSTFVQIIRSLTGSIKTWDLHYIIEEAAGSARDAQLVGRGIRAQALLRELEEAGVVTRFDNYENLVKEIKEEINNLSDLKRKVVLEIESLEKVNKTIEDHNQYLTSQLESYKAYLQNVRMQSTIQRQKKKKRNTLSILKTSLTEISNNQQQKSIFYNSNTSTSPTSPSYKNSKKPNNNSNNNNSPIGPSIFTHHQLEKDGIISESEVPEYRKTNMYLMIESPSTGAFIISLHYKGREKPIVEIDLKLDDLLEKQKDHVRLLDLEYIKLNINKLIQLLNKSFKPRSSSRLGFF